MTRRSALANPPPDEVLRAPATHAESAAEQDAAAGGRAARLIKLANGEMATASISLQRPGGRRVYARLRYKRGGRNYRYFVGEVTAQTRKQALRRAWRLAKQKKLLIDPRSSGS